MIVGMMTKKDILFIFELNACESVRQTIEDYTDLSYANCISTGKVQTRVQDIHLIRRNYSGAKYNKFKKAEASSKKIYLDKCSKKFT